MSVTSSEGNVKRADLQEEIIAIAKILGLDVVAPCTVKLAPGKEVVATALIRGFGARNGMLVVEDYQQVEELLEAIRMAGFGFSVLRGRREGAALDVDGFINVLRDWGWNGDQGTEPNWLTNSNAENVED